jgi:hypothetical protein
VPAAADAMGVFFSRSWFAGPSRELNDFVEPDEVLSFMSPSRFDPISSELHKLQDAFRALEQAWSLDAVVTFSDSYERIYPVLSADEKERAREIIDQLITRAERDSNRS